MYSTSLVYVAMVCLLQIGYSEQVCDAECAKCTNNTCTVCEAGFYVDERYTLCTQCSQYGCTCNATNTCTACLPGYYMYKQNNTCFKCKYNGCTCNTSSECNSCLSGYSFSNGLCYNCKSDCTNCIEGYYRTTSDTCKKCTDACKRCNGSSPSCSICKDRYFLENNQCHSCAERCSVCGDRSSCTLCQADFYPSGKVCCPDHCTSCSSSTTCTACKTGRYGGTCQTNCTLGCIDNVCDIDTGVCTTGCKSGYYGTTGCPCPVNCKDEVCNITDGTCSQGCRDGYYGNNCNRVCSDGCKITNGSLRCNIREGSCTHGCQLPTKHGLQCSEECSIHCVDTECDQNTALCMKGCQAGYHGDTCTLTCSQGCINGSCHGNNGSCVVRCAEGYTGEQCVSAKSDQQPAGGVVMGGAVGGVIGALIITGVAVGIICFIRQRRERKDEDRTNGTGTRTTEVSIYVNQLEVAEQGMQEPSKEQHHEHPSGSVPNNLAMTISKPGQTDVFDSQDKEDRPLLAVADGDVTGDCYYNMGALTSPVNINELAAFVAGKQSVEYKQEFKMIPHGLIKPHDASLKLENAPLNRYKGIYPYDETRVIMRDGGSDYINASYIDGYKEHKAYIATLGPTKNTILDIWRMVWQEKVGKIVMLTNLVELGVCKCEQYWSDKGEARDYTEIDVTLQAEEVFAEFTVRQFTLQKTGESRKVTHLHYTAWPDKGVPNDVTSLVEFRQKVEATSSTLEGPLLVHCSAGIGRTGTYLALDILTKEGEAEGSVNIMGCVVKLREQRVNMVQTDIQYTYLHHAVVHSLTFHCRQVTGSRFQDHFLSLCEPETNGTPQIASRFKLLQETTETRTIDEENIDENKKFKTKNRIEDTVPADRYRPRLYLNLEPGTSDYINAVYVNSYKRKYGLVLTQTPLPDTVVDFWRLVVQERTPCLVSMDDPLVENKSGIKEYMLTQFIFKGWSNTETVPPSPEHLVLLIDQVERMKSQYEESDGPIIVHCLSGSERSGLFCTVSILLEKMKTEQEVSVVNIVRSLKSRRPQVIPNLEQYTFCYRAVVMYLESFNTYSNFELK